MSHHKTLLFFGNDRISNILSIDGFSVRSFQDKLLKSLRSCWNLIHIYIIASLHVEVCFLSILTLTSQGYIHFWSLSVVSLSRELIIAIELSLVSSSYIYWGASSIKWWMVMSFILSWSWTWKTYWRSLSIKGSLLSWKLSLSWVLSWARAWKTDWWSLSIKRILTNGARIMSFSWILARSWEADRWSLTWDVSWSRNIEGCLLLSNTRIWCGWSVEIDRRSLSWNLRLWCVETNVGSVRSGRRVVLLIHIK